MQELIGTSMQGSRKQRRNRRFGLELGTPGVWRAGPVAAAVALAVLCSGCATQGDFLRLKEDVAAHHKPNRNAPDPFARIAQLSSEVDTLRQEIRDLQGELEIARRQSTDALEEARRTRTALAAQGAAGGAAAATGGNSAGAAQGASRSSEGGAGAAAVVTSGNSAPEPDEELVGYQSALDAWRADDYGNCIERFTGFLQAYPTSGYADDAAYWLADCTYKNAEFKRAVVRFNAVVSVYPESPKAPDALYRQGESLLKLGPKFHEAARTVFKRVQKDYPDSERAKEAAQQLERLGPGNPTS